MDLFLLRDDGTLESTASDTQTTQVTVECVQAPDRHIYGNDSIAWWNAVILLLGVSIVAVVGGLIIKHKTDDSIHQRYS